MKDFVILSTGETVGNPKFFHQDEKKLAKAISDVGLSEFVSQLSYKAEWYGRNLVKIDKWYPSSKRCFECGHNLDSLALDIRHWACPACGVVHDRDDNAARNIHTVGLTVCEAC